VGLAPGRVRPVDLTFGMIRFMIAQVWGTRLRFIPGAAPGHLGAFRPNKRHRTMYPDTETRTLCSGPRTSNTSRTFAGLMQLALLLALCPFAFAKPASAGSIELDFELDVFQIFEGQNLGNIGTFSGRVTFDLSGAVFSNNYLRADAVDGDLKMLFLLRTFRGAESWEQTFTEKDDSEYGVTLFGRNAPEIYFSLDAQGDPDFSTATLLFDTVGDQDNQFRDPRFGEFGALDSWNSADEPFIFDSTTGVYRGRVFAFTAIPEPSSIWLLAAGGLGIPAVGRRYRTRAFAAPAPAA